MPMTAQIDDDTRGNEQRTFHSQIPREKGVNFGQSSNDTKAARMKG